MADLALFDCCLEKIGEGQLWLAPVGERPTVSHTGEATGDVIPLQRDYGNSRHEAAHCAAQIALGGKVELATIDGPSFIRAIPGLAYPSTVVVTLAGPAADGWSRSRITRVPDDELAFWVASIRGLRGGSCDRCSAVRSVLLAVAASIGGSGFPPDEAVTAEFRWLENRAASVVMIPSVWSAITAIADRLRDVGTLYGDAVLEICRSFFEPGFLTMEA